MIYANHPTPLYRQLYQQLRDRIEKGDLEVGAKLPSIRNLAAEYGICRLTARKAIELLVYEGYVYVHHGKGTFVRRAEISDGTVAAVTSPDSAALSSRRVVSVETVTADALLSERLPIRPGDKVVRLEYVQLVGGTPVVLAVSWLSCELGVDVLDAEFECDSLYGVLEKSLNVQLWQTEEIAQAVLATERELALLELQAPAALLLIHRTTYTIQGRVVEYARVAYRGDRYTVDLPPKSWQ